MTLGDDPGGRILVVDDAADVRAIVAAALGKVGYDVEEAESGEEALAAAARQPPALVVLDVNLPGMDGLQVLARLRQRGDLPVILLTARVEEADRIAGLELGADDYVAKPFSPGELVARVRAVLRRRGAAGETGAGPRPLRFGELCIDARTRDVTVGVAAVALTHREFDLLVFLARSPRQVFTREQLLANVWSSSGEWQDPATVTEHVRRVRAKLEAAGDSPARIGTARGTGYRFEPDL